MDKIAEEILKKNELKKLTFYDEYDEHKPVDCFDIDHIPALMQAYYEDKLKEITNDDIREWAEKESGSLIEESLILKAACKGMMIGAIAMRDRKIKPRN